MLIETFPNGPFMVNTYLVSKGNQAVIIDPGNNLSGLHRFLEAKGLTPLAILATHGHIDHVAGVNPLKKQYDIPFAIHPREAKVLETIPMQAQMFGVEGISYPEIDRDIQDNETIKYGEMEFFCIPTPGHSPGSISFLIEDVLFSGDALFNLSIGRTDLPGGSYGELITAIKTKLFILPGETRVLPGHGPETTIAYEKSKNPFLK